MSYESVDKLQNALGEKVLFECKRVGIEEGIR